MPLASGVVLCQVTIAVLLAVSLSACPVARKTAPERPNFILIVTDDQRWDTLEYMPKLKRHLLSNCVTFTNAFVTTPLCCPSRASILTGQYAHNTGVLTNGPPDGGVERLRDASTLATWLQEAGYATGLFGKYLNGYERLGTYVPPGWGSWNAFVYADYYRYRVNENGVLRDYGAAPADYSTDVLAGKANEFIRRTTDRPFFLYFAPLAPHSPATSAERHKEAPVEEPRRPPSHNEMDVSDKPQWLRALPRLSLQNVQKLDRFRAKQLRTLQAVDDAIQSIHETLRDSGQLDNTVMVFMSDNGVSWGEHRRQAAKNSGHEESIRVPLVICFPRLVSAPGRRDHLALNIDIAPTLAELAGIRPAHRVNGRSLVALLTNPSAPWRSDFLVEHWPETKKGVPGFAGVRNEEWKYIEYETEGKELYRLAKDPYELENLANRPELAAIQKRLAARLAVLKRE